MKRLSSGMTPFYRTFMPFLYGAIGIVGLIATRGEFGWIALPFVVAVGYTFWFGRRLNDVWLDGDALQVKGANASFRVPLSDVLLLETRWGRLRLFVLGLDHPVGTVQKVRFIPEGFQVVFGPNPADAIEKDLQTRIHTARAARKA
jgi:hypothetical protein